MNTATYEALIVENKALKEYKNTVIELAQSAEKEVIALRASRDELLVIAEDGFLNIINNMPPQDRKSLKRQIVNVERIIKEAKALKEIYALCLGLVIYGLGIF